MAKKPSLLARSLSHGAADRPPSKADSFAELSGYRRALVDAAQARASAQAAEAARIAQAALDADLFRRTVGPIIPLQAPERARPELPKPLPIPVNTRHDEREVLREALSDLADLDAILDMDESCSFKRDGVGRDIVRKLRRGTWIVQAQIDLHGMRTDEAREAMSLFIRDSAKRGLRCVRVIHGKGLGSLNREPVLKGKVRGWLTQKDEVMAFCEARDRDGGAGAVVVLLQAQRHF